MTRVVNQYEEDDVTVIGKGRSESEIEKLGPGTRLTERDRKLIPETR